MEIIIALIIVVVAALLVSLIYIEIQTQIDDRWDREWAAYKRERGVKTPVPSKPLAPPTLIVDSKEQFVRDMWKRYYDTHPTKSHD